MTRIIVHVVIMFATFTIGIVGEVIFIAVSPVPSVSIVREAESICAYQPELPVSLDLSQPVAPEFILDYDPQKFDPRGSYYILGRKPKAFREFDVFEMVVEEVDGKASGDATLYTNYFGKNEDYHITTGNGDYTITGSVTEKRLNFVVTPLSDEDFEFRFDGHFLKRGWVADARKDQAAAVLKGKLIKLKDGVKIAESEVRFRVEYLGC